MTGTFKHHTRSFEDLLAELTFDFFGSGQHKTTMDELLLQSDALLLDVRSTEEVQILALQAAHNIPVLHIPTNDIPARVDEIPRDRPVAVFCSAGIRAAIVYAYLRTRGFDRVRILIGGYSIFTEQAKPGTLLKQMNAQRKTL